MKSNRRSVLVGLGALTVGGGAVFGTGAFSSVEAERSVTVNTEGDSAALLQITDGDTNYNGINVTEDEDGIATIEFTDLNEDAETSFDDAVDITNTGTQEVTVSVTESPADLTVEVSNETISNDETASLSFEVDLRGESPDAEGDITILAE